MTALTTALTDAANVAVPHLPPHLAARTHQLYERIRGTTHGATGSIDAPARALIAAIGTLGTLRHEMTPAHPAPVRSARRR